MATRMLIDARHQEEPRVAVLKGNRIEEFDFESVDHKQIKGNIYLAKVTRVEPSLQAAFVDFGGNRHGFLAFSEIHPDYYQIPKEDREALLEAEAEAAEEEARLRDEEEDRGEMPGDEYDADDESSEALAEDLAEDGLEEVDTSDKDDVATIEEG
ncbi:MAG: S1 RNA-binding domain-containing protein, partial [Pseudomonadota bacterium]|nr:S1 RNA-binding domain-containing protein [Pseudomonadota bacterium]